MPDQKSTNCPLTRLVSSEAKRSTGQRYNKAGWAVFMKISPINASIKPKKYAKLKIIEINFNKLKLIN